MPYSFTMTMTMKALVVAAVTLMLAGSAGAAERAPQYQSSEPADGEELHQAPSEVTVTFSEPLDASSQLAVTDECGNDIDDGATEVFGTDMTIGIRATPSGKYRVDYQATGIAGITGTTRGRFSFVVHAGKSCDGAGGHEGHGGGEEGRGGHGGHAGNGNGGTGHEGHDRPEHEGHSPAPGHDPSGGDHSMHDVGDGTPGDRGGRHGGNGHARRHGPGDQPPRMTTDPVDPNVLAAPDSAVSPVPASVEAVLAALVLAAAFGSLGGILLRMTASR